MPEKTEALPRLLKRLRLPPGSAEAGRAAVVFEEALRLSDPRGFRLRLGLPEFLARFGPHLESSPHALSRLSGCSWAWLTAATIGAALEERVQTQFAAGEAFSAYVLDFFGTWLADQALRREITAVRTGPGSFTRRLIPGCHGFSLEAQAIFVELAGERLGMALTPAFLLTPQKSVTAVIGHFDTQS